MNFSDLYGIHGKGFIECHHIFPIAKHGKRTTTLDDLALVCSNCHRMLHRKNIDSGFYTIEELKSLVAIRRSNVENL
ncbi:HNH endonuclease [Sphingobacterium mizutaii]|uniref:HNH endonuclease n=1 Tax=Sphingobacterium mizutaii TaxID=1010 RepID=UPI0016292E1B|nr:HNH endonuclease [Sphingobacterium mizutaii]